MNINYITFAQNLQRLMDENGVDRNKLCNDLGLKYSTVSEWLSAKKYPRIDKIEQLANYFRVKKSDLIEKESMHYSEDEKSAPAAPVQNTLTPRQERIVNLFNELTEPQQDNIIGRAEMLAEQNENDSAEEGAG